MVKGRKGVVIEAPGLVIEAPGQQRGERVVILMGRRWGRKGFSGGGAGLHYTCYVPQLVNEVLRDLNSDPKCRGNFVLVRLSGLVHVDNHQALLGIAAQLDLKDQLEQCVKVGL